VPGARTREADISEFESFLTKVILFLLILFVIGAIVSFIKWGY